MHKHSEPEKRRIKVQANSSRPFEQKIAKRFFCVRFFNIPYQVCLTGDNLDTVKSTAYWFGSFYPENGRNYRTNSVVFTDALSSFYRISYFRAFNKKYLIFIKNLQNTWFYKIINKFIFILYLFNIYYVKIKYNQNQKE